MFNNARCPQFLHLSFLFFIGHLKHGIPCSTLAVSTKMSYILYQCKSVLLLLWASRCHRDFEPTLMVWSCLIAFDANWQKWNPCVSIVKQCLFPILLKGQQIFFSLLILLVFLFFFYNQVCACLAFFTCGMRNHWCWPWPMQVKNRKHVHTFQPKGLSAYTNS